jgi:ABC-2 type transport system ATP-binding protein
VLLTTHYLEEADSCDQVSFIRKGKLVESGAPRQLLDRLGQHVIEVEADDLDAVVARLENGLGVALREGDTAFFRYAEDDLEKLSRLQAAAGSGIRAWRVRKPNLNDAFLWIANSGKLSR